MNYSTIIIVLLVSYSIHLLFVIPFKKIEDYHKPRGIKTNQKVLKKMMWFVAGTRYSTKLKGVMTLPWLRTMCLVFFPPTFNSFKKTLWGGIKPIPWINAVFQVMFPPMLFSVMSESLKGGSKLIDLNWEITTTNVSFVVEILFEDRTLKWEIMYGETIEEAMFKLSLMLCSEFDLNYWIGEKEFEPAA